MSMMGHLMGKLVDNVSKKYIRSYSQVGEDALLRGFFEHSEDGRRLKKGYRGFWVDVGAHDPELYSNTKMFSEMGWRGINVDASADAICRFRHRRSRDINVNLGVGKDPGFLDYYRLSWPAMNTFSKAYLEHALESSPVKLVETVKVPVVRLEQLLDKYLPSNQPIDFMTIDCEGLDIEILESNNWDKYRPDYVLIEIHSKCDNQDVLDTPAACFLRKQGYLYVGQCACTSLFKLS